MKSLAENTRGFDTTSMASSIESIDCSAPKGPSLMNAGYPENRLFAPSRRFLQSSLENEISKIVGEATQHNLLSGSSANPDLVEKLKRVLGTQLDLGEFRFANEQVQNLSQGVPALPSSGASMESQTVSGAFPKPAPSLGADASFVSTQEKLNALLAENQALRAAQGIEPDEKLSCPQGSNSTNSGEAHSQGASASTPTQANVFPIPSPPMETIPPTRRGHPYERPQNERRSESFRPPGHSRESSTNALDVDMNPTQLNPTQSNMAAAQNGDTVLMNPDENTQTPGGTAEQQYEDRSLELGQGHVQSLWNAGLNLPLNLNVRSLQFLNMSTLSLQNQFFQPWWIKRYEWSENCPRFPRTFRSTHSRTVSSNFRHCREVYEYFEKVPDELLTEEVRRYRAGRSRSSSTRLRDHVLHDF